MGSLERGRLAFLEALDGDRERVFGEFYQYAWRLLHLRPPEAFRAFCSDDRESLISDIIFRCVKDDFRVLRTYRGGSFAGWLLSVARHRALDEIRARARRREEPLLSGASEAEGIRHDRLASEVPPDQQREWRELLECARRCISRMSARCQILLWSAAQELRPREIQRLLGLGSGSNKSISDDLRYCRERLKKLLLEAGVDWTDLVSDGTRSD